MIQAFSDMIAGAAEDSQAAEEAAEQAEEAAAQAVAFGQVYTETDAQMLAVTVPAGAQVIYRRPTATGQVAPAGIVTSWWRDTTPGPKPYFTTAGGANWTVAEITQAEILSTLASALNSAFANSVLTGQSRFADGTAAAPSQTFALDTNTGAYRAGADQIGWATNGIRRLLLSALAFQVDLPITGTAVMANPTDTTAGRLVKTGDFGLGTAITLTAGDDLNSLTKTAMYYNPSAGNTAGNNYPVAAAGSLLVIAQTATSVTQRFSSHGGAGLATQVRIFERSYGNTGFTPWVEIFHQGTILGTVSQSAGVPTGRVIERGSNANGEFVKFADGTLICTCVAPAVDTTATAGSIFMHSNVLSWVFPSVFAIAPTVSGNAGSAARWLAPANASGTGTQYRVYSYGSSGAANAPVMMAIGRWF